MLANLYFPNDLKLRTLSSGLKDFDIAKNVNFVRQKIKENLLTWRGECFNNLSIGFPYRNQVFVNSPDLLAIKQSYKDTILLTPGVQSITEFDMAFDKTRRLLVIRFTVNLLSGEFFTIDARSDTDFILQI